MLFEQYEQHVQVSVYKSSMEVRLISSSFDKELFLIKFYLQLRNVNAILSETFEHYGLNNKLNSTPFNKKIAIEIHRGTYGNIDQFGRPKLKVKGQSTVKYGCIFDKFNSRERLGILNQTNWLDGLLWICSICCLDTLYGVLFFFTGSVNEI